jgi:hypothetical protein
LQHRTSKDLIAMAQQGQSKLACFVFNYNVLESVSITISISILLCGLVRCAWELCARFESFRWEACS